MRYTGFGQILFALSFAAMGALLVALPDFGTLWQTVPMKYPWHGLLTTLTGVMLLAGGLGLLVPPAARAASLALGALLLFRLLAVNMKIVFAHPLVEVVYEDMGESLVHLAGAWTIFSLLSLRGGALAKYANVRAGQILFGLALLPCGLSHFFYLNLTAPIIPSWIPFHVPLAYFTGAAHIAAGLGILFGRLLFGWLPRLAALLEAIMTSLFTLLVWPPMIVAAPNNHTNWREIVASAVFAGAAWVIAESFRQKPSTEKS